MRNAAIILAAAAAIAGLVFASYSTHDFVQHLDRQTHELHCSFLPGIAAPEVNVESGCHVTMMSPYSSVLRESVWGGIPISLPAMAVFAFLLAFALFAMIGRRQDDPRAMLFMFLAWLVPVAASAVMAYVALQTLDAACKLCIGIYASSGVGLLASLAAWLRARSVANATREIVGDQPAPSAAEPIGWAALAGAFVIGVIFVAVPVAAYAATAPDYGRYVGSCGTLAEPADPANIMIPIGPQTRSAPMLEVLDPLCPACRAFEQRFDASKVHDRTSRRVVLFPLDNRCNWMVDEAIHPGACAVSEAVLCAERDADEVIQWAFEHQEEIMAAERRRPRSCARNRADPPPAECEPARQMVRRQFPSLASCIGSPTVEARLNQSLRWAVANQLPVLTPQIYIGDSRLCDADTDLGMEFAMSRLIDRHRTRPERTIRPEDEQVREEPVAVEQPRPRVLAQPTLEVANPPDQEEQTPAPEPAPEPEPGEETAPPPAEPEPEPPPANEPAPAPAPAEEAVP